ncbi:MAG TPA: hypothetical protein PLA70_01510 [Tenuifilaceae bacterium]|nr:hypothetical protein [Tenuifilaceae bacterium]HOU62309.1 hypothetical protein [Tenuifilaceae bacterium]
MKRYEANSKNGVVGRMGIKAPSMPNATAIKPITIIKNRNQGF